MRILAKPLGLSSRQIVAAKAVLHVILSGYLLVYFYAGFTDNLGADPVKALLHFTGIGAVNTLLFTLLISPIAQYLPIPSAMRLRRLIGIYVFVYALAHLLTYISFELQFDWSLVLSEIVERPYITVGFLALLILFSLTITSPNRVKRLLGKRWQLLHNAIYLVLFLSLLHFTWSRKTALQDPLIYWCLAVVIMSFRVKKLKRRAKNH